MCCGFLLNREMWYRKPVLPSTGAGCLAIKIDEKMLKILFVLFYHPISSDNGLISQKLLLESELYYPLHVAMGVAYSCLKYGVYITT